MYLLFLNTPWNQNGFIFNQTLLKIKTESLQEFSATFQALITKLSLYALRY